MASPSFLEKYQADLVAIAEDAIAGTGDSTLAKLAELTMSYLTGIPAVGKVVGDGFRKLSVSKANENLNREMAHWNRELEHRDLVAKVVNGLSDIIQDVLAQIVRSNVAASDEILQNVRRLREELQVYRRETNPSPIVEVAGEHVARGVGDIVALDIEGAAIIRPGTRSIAEGVGSVTATRIGGGRKRDG